MMLAATEWSIGILDRSNISKFEDIGAQASTSVSTAPKQ